MNYTITVRMPCGIRHFDLEPGDLILIAAIPYVIQGKRLELFSVGVELDLDAAPDADPIHAVRSFGSDEVTLITHDQRALEVAS